MLPRNDPDHIQIAFDDHRLVATAGLILPITLARQWRAPPTWRRPPIMSRLVNSTPFLRWIGAKPKPR